MDDQRNPSELPNAPESVAPPAAPLARLLTVPGRILLVICFLGWLGGTILYFAETFPGFPAGRYPVLLWCVPTAIAAAILFAIAALILERAGVRVYKREGE